MEINLTKLFVYGSLRKGFHEAPFEYISSHFTLFGEGRVKGKLFYTGEYPAAVPSKEDEFVVGEIYELNKDEEFLWAMDQLDDYEGATLQEEEEQQLYRREIADVYFNDQVIKAWIYWYNGNIDGKTFIKSGNIFDHIAPSNQT